MGYQSPRTSRFWALVAEQHDVVTRAQLLELGWRPQGIKHRVAKGRLHPVTRGVYAVGRPRLTRNGRWMAAILACGPEAVLSHESAAELWGIRPPARGPVEVSVPERVTRRRTGIVVHRRRLLGAEEVTRRRGIPVTTPVRTLIDLAGRLTRDELEAAISEADKRDLTNPEELRSALDGLRGWPGAGLLRKTVESPTFAVTDSELERRFLPIAGKAGLPRPETRRYVNGFKVDFYWPDLGLVVETDGLRYHRTPTQQLRDRIRDQAHTAAGLTPVRFTRAQVRFEPGYVEATLRAIAGRLRDRMSGDKRS